MASNYETCVSAPGEPCFHESYLFAVGETGHATVELDIYRPDGLLCVLVVSGYTSWKRVVDKWYGSGKRTVRRFSDTVLIDCVTREEHCLTIHCGGIDLVFFGRAIDLQMEYVADVESIIWFGEAHGRAYRRKYAGYFTAYRKSIAQAVCAGADLMSDAADAVQDRVGGEGG